MGRGRRLLVLAWSALCLACAEPRAFATGGGPGNDEPSTCDRVTEVPEDVASELSLDPAFYARHCSVFGIDVLGSERVRDPVMLEAGRIVQGVLQGRDALRDALHERWFRVVIVASSAGEELRDVPELSGLRSAENAAAGIGADPDFPAAAVRDSVILCRPIEMDPAATPPGDTLVHELGHALLDMGLPHTDPGFRARLDDAYAGAKASGVWTIEVPPVVKALFGELSSRNYLMTNAEEYWATGVSAWFGFKPIPFAYELSRDDPPELLLSAVFGRDALREHDPPLAELLEEVLGPSPELAPSCPEWIPQFEP